MLQSVSMMFPSVVAMMRMQEFMDVVRSETYYSGP